MKRYIALWWLFLCAVLAAGARGWTPETLPMVHLQEARRYVCNPDGVLSQAAVDSTDVLLARLERDKGVETVVVAVKRLEGGDPYRFGMELGRKYGVGDAKQRTGLIFIIATEDRTYQILTGNGLEGTLPDAICRRIQNRVTVPALKRGDWDAAVVQSMKVIDGYIRGDASLHAQEAEGSDVDSMITGVAIAIFIICLLVVSFYKTLAARYCPRCHRHTMRVVREERITRGDSTWIRRHWRCRHCGHEETTADREPPRGGGLHHGVWLPPFIISGGRSGSGGGGFGGGSFGGGSFGGGGSGGSF